MPIEVTCPSCHATLPAPDEFAGQKIRCADCQGIVEVPAEFARPVAKEQPQTYGLADQRPKKQRRANDGEHATPARRKPKKEWDDDDDDEENESRKRRGNKPKGFPMIWLVIVGALGLSAIIWGVVHFGPSLFAPNAGRNLVVKYKDRLKTRASSTYQSYPVTQLFDGNETSIWFSGNNDTVGSGKSPWVEVTFPEDVTIHAMTILGNRNKQWPGYHVHAGRFDFIDAAGKTLSSHDVTARGEKFDMKTALSADVTGVRTVRFTVTKDQSPDWIALSEWTLE